MWICQLVIAMQTQANYMDGALTVANYHFSCWLAGLYTMMLNFGQTNKSVRVYWRVVASLYDSDDTQYILIKRRIFSG